MAAYDPTTPIIPQSHDWDCAEQSTLWAMTAFGRRPSDAWMEQSMLSGGIESTDLGLLVADGSKLAGWITEQYGEFNYSAHNAARVSFDDVKSVAGQTPVLIGGHKWGPGGHWSGVRGYDPNADVLLLANPADGYTGVFQTMTRQQFNDRAPFSMVVVTWQDPAPPVVVKPPAPTPAPVPPSFRVGPGVLAEMDRRSDEPITSEVYHEQDGVTQYSTTIGRSGSTYLYAFSTGEVYVTHTDVTAAGRS